MSVNLLVPELNTPRKRPPYSNLYRINRQHHLSRGLVANWPLTEGAGRAAINVLGAGWGSFDSGMGADNWVDTPGGMSLCFDGSSDLLTIAQQDAFNLTIFTYMMWIKPTIASSTLIIEQALSHRAVIASGNATCLFSWSHTNASFQRAWAFKSGANWHPAKLSAMNAGEWNLVVCTYDGTNLRGYRNGSLDVTVAAGTPDTGPASLYLGGTVGVGGSPQSHFAGCMADLRIYDRALSLDEIGEAYRYPSGILEPVWEPRIIPSAPSGISIPIVQHHRRMQGVM